MVMNGMSKRSNIFQGVSICLWSPREVMKMKFIHLKGLMGGRGKKKHDIIEIK